MVEYNETLQADPNVAEMLFHDRRAAGRALGKDLARRRLRCSAVLGLIRGGVPVAFEVAAALDVPMDVLVVKKLRALISPELAIGAICTDGTGVLRQELFGELGVTDEYLAREVEARLEEARRAERLYCGEQPALDIAGAAVVIVDDGIATGATMEAGVLGARSRGAASVGVATPVGSRAACESVGRVADEVICLTTPVELWAVGQFYVDFAQVADEEVRELLKASRALHAGTDGR